MKNKMVQACMLLAIVPVIWGCASSKTPAQQAGTQPAPIQEQQTDEDRMYVTYLSEVWEKRGENYYSSDEHDQVRIVQDTMLVIDTDMTFYNVPDGESETSYTKGGFYVGEGVTLTICDDGGGHTLTFEGCGIDCNEGTVVIRSGIFLFEQDEDGNSGGLSGKRVVIEGGRIRGGYLGTFSLGELAEEELVITGGDIWLKDEDYAPLVSGNFRMEGGTLLVEGYYGLTVEEGGSAIFTGGQADFLVTEEGIRQNDLYNYGEASSLSVSGGDVRISSPDGHGIAWEKGDIEITDGTLDIRALSTGIVIGTGDLTMSGGDLQITLSGKIGEQRAYRDIYSYGRVEFAETGIIVGCGNVLMSGGNARIDGRQGVTIGKGYLFSPRSKKGEKVGGVFTMEGGTLECTGPEAGISVVGPGTGFDEEGNGSLWWDDDYEEVNAIVIRGGTLRTDGDGVHYAISTIAAGILIEGGTVETTMIGTIGGSVTIKGGEVTVINPQERAYAPGIYLDKLGNAVRHFRMSGGTLTVESKDCGVCLSHPGQRAEITGGTLRATGTSMGAIYAETLYVGNKMTITTPQGGKVSDVTVYPDNFQGITAQGSTVIAKEVVIEQTQ